MGHSHAEYVQFKVAFRGLLPEAYIVFVTSGEGENCQRDPEAGGDG